LPQTFLAGLLQDVVHQGQQLHVARLGVLAALEAAQRARNGRLDDRHLVVDQKRAQRGTANHGHFPRQRLQDRTHVAAVGDEHPEHGTQCDDPTDDDEHVR
jgi:hypothetical protein